MRLTLTGLGLVTSLRKEVRDQCFKGGFYYFCCLGYTWSDGSPVSFVNWNDGEPNNYGDNEDCAQIIVGLGGAWNDVHCGVEVKAVCEKKGL